MCDLVGGTDSGFGDLPEFAVERVVRGRNHYSCEVCAERIAAGTYHVTVTGKWDQNVETLRLHLQCRALCARTAQDGESYTYAEMLASVGDTRLINLHVATVLWGQGGAWVQAPETEA